MSTATLPAPYSILTLYLCPLDNSGGAYTRTPEELRALLDAFAARGVEEWEVAVIDGDHSRIVDAASRRGLCAEELYALALELEQDDNAAPAICYLLEDCGAHYPTAEELLDHARDLSLFEGTAEDYADSIVDELYNIPSQLRYYIDCEALGRDMSLNGDIATFEYDGRCFVVTNPND